MPRPGLINTKLLIGWDVFPALFDWQIGVANHPQPISPSTEVTVFESGVGVR